MARAYSERTQNCRCTHGCGTSATITRWSCGCVEVDIHNDQSPGGDCSDFSGMRYFCGDSGSLSSHGREEYGGRANDQQDHSSASREEPSDYQRSSYTPPPGDALWSAIWLAASAFIGFVLLRIGAANPGSPNLQGALPFPILVCVFAFAWNGIVLVHRYTRDHAWTYEDGAVYRSRKDREN